MPDPQTPKRPALLVVASEPGRRRAIERAIEGAGLARVLAMHPERLRDRARWVDAAAAVVVIAAGDDAGFVEQLAELRDLPAARAAALLVQRGTDDDLVRSAHAVLHPLATLDDPPTPLALELSVAALLPAAEVGQPARAQHRRAPALLGVSRAMREVIDQVRRVAASRMPVLILGETGTGKELVARAVHEQSPRARRAFVPINCGALPEALLESELFGVERGAFTGASRAKPGVLEQADGGTLFLDEIGDMPASMQVKLLRVLESGELRRLGSTRRRCVDLRIVSATHRDLEALIEEEVFRQDLWFRINSATIYVPPLRRRPVDIPFLAQHFAEEFGEEHARRIALSDDFVEALSQHDFPGNVRELRNAIERAIALGAPGDPLTREHLAGVMRDAPRLPGAGPLRERVAQLEAHAIREALQTSGGNRTHAAQALGLSRVGLRQKMKRLGIG